MKLENVSDVYPLSPMQEGMLFHSIAEPDSGVYVDQAVITLQGDLDTNQLAELIQKVCARMEALRTVFLWDGVDQPLQIVRERVDFPVEESDLQSLGKARQRQHLLELIERNKTQRFELNDAPLIRSSILKCNSEQTWLVVCFHHMILDGWSVYSVLGRILDDYEEDSREQEEFRFRNYIEWILEQDHAGAAKFWKQELSGFSEPNVIGSGESTNIKSRDDQQSGVTLSKGLSDGLRGLAKKNRVTLNTVMQAAWSLVVGRYSDSTDVVFGTTVAGRPLNLTGIESGIGSFINTIPFRTQLDGSLGLTDWLSQIQRRQSECREWEFSSLVQIQKQADIPVAASLFETILVFENYPAMDRNIGSIQIGEIEHFERSNYPLAFLIVPSDEIELILVSDASRFDQAFVSRLHEHLEYLLEEFTQTPDQKLKVLMANLPPKQFESLSSWNQVADGFTEDQGVTNVHQLIQSAAEKNPDSIAANYDGEQLTYGQLVRRAETVAKELRATGVKRNSPVGLCVERSFEMLIGILGILKAGGYYVPLDVIYPKEHFQYVLTDTRAKVVLTKQQHIDRFSTVDDFCDLVLFEDVQLEPGFQFSDITVAPDDEQLAYVIYTSGSTGKPKGVMISHGNLVHSTMARSRYYEADPERFLLLSSFAFDSSVAGIFWTLCTGGTLVLPKSGAEQDMVGLVELIQDSKVTHLLCLPALYQLIVETADPGQLKHLTTAIVAGESVNPKVVIDHFSKLSRTQLYNEYGPTEGTVWATAHQMLPDEGNSRIPIGKPIPHVGVLLLSKDQNRVPIGCPGEIYLYGPGIAKGYLNRADLSREKFLEIPGYDGKVKRVYQTGDLGYFRDDGSLMFCGRVDRQVKIRGYRVELREIESVLQSMDDVVESVVVTRKTSETSASRIHVYVTGENLPESLDQWLVRLEGKLPEFMMPDTVTSLVEIPRLPNGKVDHSALPISIETASQDQFVPPRNEVEKKLAQIWSDTIGVTRIGVYDNFFSLGGDSIISIQVVSRARRSGLQIQPKHIAQYPTIASLAGVVEPEIETTLDIQTNEPFPLAPIQQWFFEQRFFEPNHWNQSQFLKFAHGYQFEHVRSAIATVVRSHAMLRARFQNVDNQWIQQVAHEDEALEISTVDMAGCGADEFDKACRKAQSSLNIEQGPLIRLVRFVNTSQDFDLLLFVVHHLVIDAVSWHLLLDDVNSAYRELVQGAIPNVASIPCSFSRWTRQLAKTSAQLSDQLDLWTRILKGRPSIPFDNEPATPVTERSVEVAKFALDVEMTELLQKNANAAYNTKLDDLLVSALSMAIAAWSGSSRVVVELESHGREHDFGDFDLSRTVGWFTNSYPVSFSVTDDPGSTIRSVKESLRQIPDQGLGYGLLRYLNKSTRHILKRLPQPQILYNNLGTQNSKRGQAVLERFGDANQTSRNPLNAKTHPIEINAAIVDSVLTVTLTSSRDLHNSQTIHQLIEQLKRQLQIVIEHCCQQSELGFTPSDFAESGLSQNELDEFLSGFD